MYQESHGSKSSRRFVTACCLLCKNAYSRSEGRLDFVDVTHLQSLAGVKHTDNAALTYSGYRDVLQGSVRQAYSVRWQDCNRADLSKLQGEIFTNLNPTGSRLVYIMPGPLLVECWPFPFQ